VVDGSLTGRLIVAVLMARMGVGIGHIASGSSNRKELFRANRISTGASHRNEFGRAIAIGLFACGSVDLDSKFAVLVGRRLIG
jgi:hypothetical protein